MIMGERVATPKKRHLFFCMPKELEAHLINACHTELMAKTSNPAIRVGLGSTNGWCYPGGLPYEMGSYLRICLIFAKHQYSPPTIRSVVVYPAFEYIYVGTS